MPRCPHCHAIARFERSPSMRWRCAVCGGPIVPSEGAIARAHSELPSLVAAQRTRAMAVGWAAAAFVFGAAALPALFLGVALWHWAPVGALLLAAVGVGALILTLASARRSRARNAEARAMLEDAWERAAGEIVSARSSEVTPPELARELRTDDAHAEALLSRLSAAGRVRVAVRDDAQLAYTADGTGDAELRSPAEVGERRT